MNDGLKPPTVCVVVAESSLDVSTRWRVDSQLRSATAPDAPLVVDWSNVRYADRLGLETLFDFLIERKASVAFSGVCRDLEHFFWRLQILPLLPIAATPDQAAALIDCSP